MTDPTPALTAQVRQHVPGYGGNSGHGHAWRRPDGVRTRCGGPRLCVRCARDRIAVDQALEAIAAAAAAARAAPDLPLEGC